MNAARKPARIIPITPMGKWIRWRTTGRTLSAWSTSNIGWSIVKPNTATPVHIAQRDRRKKLHNPPAFDASRALLVERNR
jgi:hypothetical protein